MGGLVVDRAGTPEFRPGGSVGVSRTFWVEHSTLSVTHVEVFADAGGPLVGNCSPTLWLVVDNHWKTILSIADLHTSVKR